MILQLSYLARDSGGHCSLRAEYGASVTLHARDARDEAQNAEESSYGHNNEEYEGV
jgi:hypothetical protein